MGTNSKETAAVRRISRHRLLRHPIPACILLTLWGVLFYQGAAGVLAILLGMPDRAELFASACGVLLLLIHLLWFYPEFRGCIHPAGMKDRQMWRIILVWLAMELALLSVGYIRSGFNTFSLAMLNGALMAGITEEAVFRALGVSVMMRSYKDGGSILPAVVLPAVLFGLFHFSNMTAGASLSATIGQVIFAAGTGFFFAAIYLRSGSLVPTILIHSLYDLAVMMQGGTTSGTYTQEVGIGFILIQTAVAAVEIVLTRWMLKGRTAEIQARWRTIWRTPVPAEQTPPTEGSAGTPAD